MASKTIVFVTLWVALFALPQLRAQHCPPIVESYLSQTQVKRSDDGLQLSLRYCKTGGQSMAAYQAYVVAYSDKNSDKVFELTPQEAISKKLVTIVHTQLAQRNADGEYEIEYKLNTQQFTQLLLKEKQVSVDAILDAGGWKSFDSPIRLAVFIPFLEDQEYSRIEGLPEKKHECNYADESALYFDSLPQQLQICFGIVQAVKLDEGVYYVQVQGRSCLK